MGSRRITRGCVTIVLLERESELDLVGRTLRRAAGGMGGVIVLAGPLGNGRTALLHALAGCPAAEDFLVLRASASPIERDFAGGVVQQLLESADAPVDSWDDVACGEKPLLVLVDDLQWADDESLGLIGMLAKDAPHTRVVVAVTVCEGDPQAGREAVVSFVAGAEHRVRPRAFTTAGTAALLRHRLGSDCDDAFVLACHEETGGLPLLVTSLALAWNAGGQPPVAANAEAVRAIRPVHVRDRLVACLRAQPEPVRALLTALAVAGTGLPDAAELAGLDRITALEATGILRKLGLLSSTGFARPCVRDAAMALLTAAEREELQIRAARLWYSSGRPEKEVADLLLGITRPQGAWVVEVLRVAAETASNQGSPEQAARYLRRALLDASADGEDRAGVLVDLASAVRGFDVHAFVRTISYAVPLLRDPRDRASALVRLTPAVIGDVPEAVLVLLRRTAEELGDPALLDPADRDLALRIEARLRYAGSTERDELTAAAARLAALGPRPPLSTGAERELLAVLLHAVTVGVRGSATEVAALAQHLLDHEPAAATHGRSVAPLLVGCLAVADAPGATTNWLEQALVTARSRGDVAEQAMIRSEQALVHLLSGRVDEAARAAADAFELKAWDWTVVGTSAVVVSAGVALRLRDNELTERILAFADERPRHEWLDAIAGLLRASTAALRGDLPGAAASLAECGARLDRCGWRNPALFAWRTSLALIRSQLGETEEAVALAEEERLIAQEWGAPSGIGRALRVLGAVTGDVELTRRAVEVLEGSSHALELALALRQWGEQSGRGDVWRRCLRVAQDIGAQDIADRAQVAIGSTTPLSSVAHLTPSERRVAVFAASGRSNQEIAEELAVTPRAVEKHLTSTYRKLGVKGRAELAEMLQHAGA